MTDPNQNRSGYKKTRVGWIPEEWGATRFKSLSHMMANGFSLISRVAAVFERGYTWCMYSGTSTSRLFKSYLSSLPSAETLLVGALKRPVKKPKPDEKEQPAKGGLSDLLGWKL